MNRGFLNARLIFTIGCLLLSALYLYAASSFPVGEMKRPGVGFVPLLTGIVAAVFSAAELIKCLASGSGEGESAGAAGFAWAKLAMFLGCAALYVAIIYFFGYLVATFVVLFLLVKLFGEKSWVKPLVFSALLSYGSFFLFTRVLLVPLP